MNWEFVTLMITVIGSAAACHRSLHNDMKEMKVGIKSEWQRELAESKQQWKAIDERWERLFSRLVERA